MTDEQQKEYQVTIITYDTERDCVNSESLFKSCMANIPEQAAIMFHTSIRKELNTDDAFYISVVEEDKSKTKFFRCIARKTEHKPESQSEEMMNARRSIKTEEITLENAQNELKMAKIGMIKVRNKEIEKLAIKNLMSFLDFFEKDASND